VLQHAFLTPEPVHQSAASHGQATYADLFQLAVASVDRACDMRTGSLAEVALEMRGVENFLLAAGRHLQLIAPLAPPLSGSRQLRDFLVQKRALPVRTGAWAEAARAVALTTELLATHHVDTGPATPQMTELYRTRSQDLAVGRVLALVLAACGGGRDLTRHARSLRKRLRTEMHDAQIPLSQSRIDGLDRLVETAAHHAQAGLWQLERTVRSPSQLDLLTAATPHLAETSGPRTFPDPLSAVQALRRIAYRQAQGLESASPGSLNDLAHLAATVTDPDADWIQSRNHQCATGLERVQLAHLRDQLAPAHQAWTDALEGLTTSIQGITKAPANLAAAYREVGQHLHDPVVAAALIEALPQLGRNASATLTRLGSEGALVSAGREPGALSIAWRPITPGQTRRLAAGFAAAAKASAAPAATYRDLQSRASDPRRAERQPVASAPRITQPLPGQQRTR